VEGKTRPETRGWGEQSKPLPQQLAGLSRALALTRRHHSGKPRGTQVKSKKALQTGGGAGPLKALAGGIQNTAPSDTRQERSPPLVTGRKSGEKPKSTQGRGGKVEEKMLGEGGVVNPGGTPQKVSGGERQKIRRNAPQSARRVGGGHITNDDEDGKNVNGKEGRT